jgi:uroporphyrinogen decarboxylase
MGNGPETFFELAARGLLKRSHFEPAIYEHKAALLGCSVAEVATSADRLVKAIMAEIETYRADAVTVGVDVYNVEAEAIGCSLNYDVPTNETPQLVEPLLDSLDGWEQLTVPDPERDGRMPLFLEAASQVRGRKPPEIVLRGAVSGPFSLAASLVGFETLLMGMLDKPDDVRGLLNYALEVSLVFAAGYLRRGVDPVYFDSRCAPPLLSPQLYAGLVMPLHAELVLKTRALGAKQVPIIIGGDTSGILPTLLKTGADYLLCDAPAPFGPFREAAQSLGIFVRRNLDAGLVCRGPVRAIEAAAEESLAEAKGLCTFVLGTGIVPYDTPPAHILAVAAIAKQGSSG